jgi:hypothetical protein
VPFIGRGGSSPPSDTDHIPLVRVERSLGPHKLFPGQPSGPSEVLGQSSLGARPWTGVPLLDLLYGDARHLLDQTRYAQIGIVSVQVAMVASLRLAGIRPDVIAGHSLGELTAAWAAGALSLQSSSRVRPLTVSHAFHSAVMEQALAPFADAVAATLLAPPDAPGPDMTAPTRRPPTVPTRARRRGPSTMASEYGLKQHFNGEAARLIGGKVRAVRLPEYPTAVAARVDPRGRTRRLLKKRLRFDPSLRKVSVRNCFVLMGERENARMTTLQLRPRIAVRAAGLVDVPAVVRLFAPPLTADWERTQSAMRVMLAHLALEEGQVWVAERADASLLAAAVWLPPGTGTEPPDAGVSSLLARELAIRPPEHPVLSTALKEAGPDEPHWAVVTVCAPDDTEAWDRTVVAELLAPGLRAVDDEDATAVAITVTARHVDQLRPLGFRRPREVHVAPGTSIWLATRHPKSRAWQPG